MSKAKERALEAYPERWWRDCDGDAWDANEKRREGFIQGYEQAEKDLALTLEDIESIVKIADSLLTGTAWDAVDWPDEQKYYEEVLKRFKEAKK